jgi:tetratricopeptide (TPR) repeat protein
MARIQAKEKNIAKATAYYHRAIFGHWESDVARHQGEARTELVELLAREGLKKDLLAELIPLQDEVSGDPSAEMRIARLYLFAGSPARAVDLYHQVLSEAPDRADAQAGLGEAEFARGNYRTARADFRAALRLKQDDNVIRKKLDRTNEVLALQPIRRDLNSRERYRRSLEVLNLVLASLIQCTGATRAASIADQINLVQAALSRSVRPAEESDAAESNVDLAERTWDLRKLQCGTAVTENDQILELALAKVGQ